MTTRIVTYTTRDERNALVDAAERVGEVMLHDEDRGGILTLVFGTADELPPIEATPIFVPDADYAAAVTDSDRLAVIARRLGLIQ